MPNRSHVTTQPSSPLLSTPSVVRTTSHTAIAAARTRCILGYGKTSVCLMPNPSNAQIHSFGVAIVDVASVDNFPSCAHLASDEDESSHPESEDHSYLC